MQSQELRKLRGDMRAKELAKCLGISPQTLSRYENGHMPIPPAIAYAVRWLRQAAAVEQVPEAKLLEGLRSVIRETVSQ